MKRRKTRPANKDRVDRRWFSDRLADKKMSLRDLAGDLGYPPSSLSRRFNGKIRITMAEAADLAVALDQPYEEVVRRAGIVIPSEMEDAVEVVGVVDAKGHASSLGREGARRVPRPLRAPAGTVALRVTAPGLGVDGWLMFYVATKRVEPSAIGRLAVVATAGGKKLARVVSRGNLRGTWTLSTLWGDGESVDAVLDWAAPVTDIRC